MDRIASDWTTDAEIDAYNAAFDELGLNWQWDRSVMRAACRYSRGERAHHASICEGTSLIC